MLTFLRAFMPWEFQTAVYAVCRTFSMEHFLRTSNGTSFGGFWWLLLSESGLLKFFTLLNWVPSYPSSASHCLSLILYGSSCTCCLRPCLPIASKTSKTCRASWKFKFKLDLTVSLRSLGLMLPLPFSSMILKASRGSMPTSCSRASVSRRMPCRCFAARSLSGRKSQATGVSCHGGGWALRRTWYDAIQNSRITSGVVETMPGPRPCCMVFSSASSISFLYCVSACRKNMHCDIATSCQRKTACFQPGEASSTVRPGGSLLRSLRAILHLGLSGKNEPCLIL
mmetsp:Transcript_74894/g.129806  ORF Transcript_74894/g.129806 Transcript_74894/m.129806 type:complete len:283 (+) Transcript_74894:829-1677(+)